MQPEPVTHAPVAVSQLSVPVHALQAAPLAPHWFFVSLARATQVVARQQPEQFEELQPPPLPEHFPELHCWPERHAAQFEPLAPHAAAVFPCWHLPILSTQPRHWHTPSALHWAAPWHVAQAAPWIPQAGLVSPGYWQLPVASQQPEHVADEQVPVPPSPPPVPQTPSEQLCPSAQT